MTKRRTIRVLGVFLGVSGLAWSVFGCDSGQSGSGLHPAAEVKVTPPVGSSTSVSEEYQNLSPAGKAR